jgi:hypothetical protein
MKWEKVRNDIQTNDIYYENKDFKINGIIQCSKMSKNADGRYLKTMKQRERPTIPGISTEIDNASKIRIF